MKQTMVLAAILASIIVLSCDEMGYFDIDVANDCTWEIKVAIITQAKRDKIGAPPDLSSFISINPRSGRVFRHLEVNRYYIYIIPKDPNNPGDETISAAHNQTAMIVDKYDTWVVRWDSEAEKYKIAYTRTP